MNNYDIIVPISPDPNYGYKRTATMAGLLINAVPFMGENITLSIQVNYFEQDDRPIDIIPPRIVPLVFDKTTCVDRNGATVRCDSPDAVMTEFEYYMSLLHQGVVIADKVTQKILWADSKGAFN
jgi:hypothetical protein